MADVFISYARDDEACARRVAKSLQAAGLDVWWDADLPAHRAYSEEIERNLAAAKAVVVLWSATAAKSQWVRAEADFARNAGKLVQAQVDGTLPPMPFNQIQCAELKGWRGNSKHAGWAKLQSSVQALVSGKDVPRSPVRASAWDRLPGKRWWAAAAVLLLIAAAGLFLFLRSPGEERKPVLAVLPFKSLDARDESLVAGMWEDTRQAIGRNPQLVVLGPNTAQELAAKRSGAARKVADYLVQASIRSVGDRIRVSADLVRTKDSAQVWSQSFDRQLDDVFQLQQEIAGEIEGHIRGRLAERGGIKPENIATNGEVYAIYSDARAKLRSRQDQTYHQAHVQLERVVRMDPNFAPGWATLAVIKQFDIGGPTSQSSAEADARRAVALAPNLAAAHAALGFVLGHGPAAQAELRRAIDLDPNDIEAIHWLANSLDARTERDEKLRLYSRVAELEPLWWPAILNKLDLLFEGGSTAAVEEELARVERTGDPLMITALKMSIARYKGDLSSAIDLGLAYYRTGPKEDRTFILNFLWPPLMQLGYYEVGDQLSPPPADFIPFIRKNDPRAIGMIEAEASPKQFWTNALLATVGGRVYLLNHQGPRLAARYRHVASSPEQFEALIGKNDFPLVAPTAALALKSVGDDAQARRLLELAEADAEESSGNGPEAQMTLARIYAVEGRTGQGIALLSSAIRNGWLPSFLPIHTDIATDPPLAELRRDRRFEVLRQQILGHLAKERAELGPVKLN